jgi:hypothetical protein
MAFKLPQNQPSIKQSFVRYNAYNTDYLTNIVLQLEFCLNNQFFGLIYKFLSLLIKKLQIRHKISVFKS